MPDQPKYDPDIHHRRSLRLKEYDYSRTGAYFVTICTQNREWVFGDIINDEMRLNDAGVIVRDVWNETQHHFPIIDLDTYIIMPNHFHGIIFVGAGFSRPLSGFSRPLSGFSRPDVSHLNGMVDTISNTDQNQKGREDRSPTVGNIVAYFKHQSTKQINLIRNAGFQKLWQRNYYDHIIRDDDDLNRIREYIDNNPANWMQDELFK